LQAIFASKNIFPIGKNAYHWAALNQAIPLPIKPGSGYLRPYRYKETIKIGYGLRIPGTSIVGIGREPFGSKEIL
jgi:hypothetical protein